MRLAENTNDLAEGVLSEGAATCVHCNFNGPALYTHPQIFNEPCGRVLCKGCISWCCLMLPFLFITGVNIHHQHAFFSAMTVI